MTDLADLAGSLSGGEPGNRNRAGMMKDANTRAWPS